MRVHRLALLALVTLAGCTVDGSAYRPMTDAECKIANKANGYWKACGYRCVREDDPATHCADAGDCSPCPGDDPVHHAHAVCRRAACAIRCDGGSADCNGDASDGCETTLFSGDPHNCGACGRTCAGCVKGSCPGERLTLSPAPALPRGIVNHEGALYYVDATGGGQLRSVDRGGAVVASGLGADPRWAVSWPGQGVLVAGDAPAASGEGRDLALTVVDPGGAATVVVSAPGAAGEAVDGLAVDGGIVLFTRTAVDGLWAFDANYGTSLALAIASPRGITFHKGKTYVGSATPLTSIRWVKGAVGSGFTSDVARAAAAAGASRLAVYDNPDRLWTPFLFWISEADGSVRSAPADGSGASVYTKVNPGASAGHADMVADAEGVYWSNWASGEIQMWRASDGETFTIATSAHPRALALRGKTLYWSDDGTNPSAVYSTAIPLR
jgi:sugar lactone lactonase YvrE